MKKQQIRLHLTGDSLMARHEGRDQPMINDCLNQLADFSLEIINTAVSGHNTADLLARLDQEILSQAQVDFICILIGTNDLASHKQIHLPTFEANLKQILKKLSRIYESKQITLISPPPVDESKQRHRTNRRIREYSACIKKIAFQENCRFVDLYKIFTKNPKPTEELLIGSLNDGLHFGKAGYELLAQTILEALGL
ncbi:DUF459 domain-containing protein [Streptococcus merionis]|uniref:DUF459 domain-containing protein n=1 Tax=Streptococcus merionis TaxID=400065 RepID=UPI003F7F4A53